MSLQFCEGVPTRRGRHPAPDHLEEHVVAPLGLLDVDRRGHEHQHRLERVRVQIRQRPPPKYRTRPVHGDGLRRARRGRDRVPAALLLSNPTPPELAILLLATTLAPT